MEKETKTFVVDMEFSFNQKRDLIWNAFVNETASWWKRDFCATSNGKIIFEPKLGGRMYEDCGNGTGLTWYTIESIIPNESIVMSGVLDHTWGGPAFSLLNLKFEEDGESTTLKLVDSYIGHITEKTCQSFQPGWMSIFGDAFKTYVEGK